jgi:hypothetical protein
MPLRAKNDRLIEQFLADPAFDVRPDGTIWAGAERLGRLDKENYVEIYYRGRRLKAHRIVYRKFKGELDPKMVVDHADRNTSNNHPDNLELVTPLRNSEYCWRRKHDRPSPRRPRCSVE